MLVYDLIDEASRLLKCDAECLRQLRVQGDYFSRAAIKIEGDICQATRIVRKSEDSAGMPQFNFKRALDGYQVQKCRELATEAARIVRQHEEHPADTLRLLVDSGTFASGKRRGRMTLETAEAAVREHFQKHPDDTREVIAKKVGCSVGQVSKTMIGEKTKDLQRAKRGSIGRPPGKRIGLDIALEEQGTVGEVDRKAREENVDEELDSESRADTPENGDQVPQNDELQRLIAEQQREHQASVRARSRPRR